MEIKEMLDTLAEYQAQRDVMMLDKQEMVDSVLTPEIKAKIADIEAEFSDKAAGVTENISKMEAEVKQAVLDNGSSVKGNALQAVFTKGRVSWDTKSLDGYVVAHPELLPFRKEGEPSVSIRKVV
jgi:phage host-nuclease inhibitor protein Gam